MHSDYTLSKMPATAIGMNVLPIIERSVVIMCETLGGLGRFLIIVHWNMKWKSNCWCRIGNIDIDTDINFLSVIFVEIYGTNVGGTSKIRAGHYF